MHHWTGILTFISIVVGLIGALFGFLAWLQARKTNKVQAVDQAVEEGGANRGGRATQRSPWNVGVHLCQASCIFNGFLNLSWMRENN